MKRFFMGVEKESLTIKNLSLSLQRILNVQVHNSK